MLLCLELTHRLAVYITWQHKASLFERTLKVNRSHFLPLQANLIPIYRFQCESRYSIWFIILKQFSGNPTPLSEAWNTNCPLVSLCIPLRPRALSQQGMPFCSSPDSWGVHRLKQGYQDALEQTNTTEFETHPCWTGVEIKGTGEVRAWYIHICRYMYNCYLSNYMFVQDLSRHKLFKLIRSVFSILRGFWCEPTRKHRKKHLSQTKPQTMDFLTSHIWNNPVDGSIWCFLKRKLMESNIIQLLRPRPHHPTLQPSTSIAFIEATAVILFGLLKWHLPTITRKQIVHFLAAKTTYKHCSLLQIAIHRF